MGILVLLNSYWQEILWGAEETDFLSQVAVRTALMFLIIVIALRSLGKRGVKQLSVFELVVIIGLGSAAGDPMFYKEVGIVFSLLVFVIIIGFYAFITFWVAKSKKFEDLVEGKSVCLIEKGVFTIDNFKKENLGSEEFFSELRLKGISQLGQIETAIEETSGEVSVFYYPPEETRYGLPIMLNSLDNPLTYIDKAAHYSCTFCGYTEEKTPGPASPCPSCQKKQWVKASKKVRIT